MAKTLRVEETFNHNITGHLCCLREFVGGPDKKWKVSVVKTKGLRGTSAACEVIEMSELEILAAQVPANVRNTAPTSKKPMVRIAKPLTGVALLMSMYENRPKKTPTNGTVGNPNPSFA